MAYNPNNPNGQATMANSTPVVIANNQSAVPVSATDLDIRNLTNTDVVTAELSATDNAVLDAIDTVLDTINAKLVTGTVIGDVNLGAADSTNLNNVDTAVTSMNSKMVSGTDIGDVTINNASGVNAVNIQDGGNTITVDGSVTVSATDLDIRNLVAATDIVDLGGNALTSLQLIDNAVSGAGFNITQVNGEAIDVGSGTEAAAIRVTLPTDGTGVLTVKQATAGNLNMTEASASAIKTAVELIDDSIYVDDADWTADTSKHALVGAVTQVVATVNTDGDTTPLVTNLFRELRVAIPESDLATATTAHVKKYYTNAGAVTDGIIWSPAAGKRWYVTDIYIQVSAASTVTLEDDLAGGDSPIWKAELAANSGWSHSFATPWYSGEDAADLIITTSAGNVYVMCTGYEI